MADLSGAPVQLIRVDPDGSFHVEEAAVKKLEKIKGKIAVVAVAGLYRTGKSFLLNLLVNKQTATATANVNTGFAVGGTINACTKGIWMWGEPFVLDNGTSVIFLDTEGIGSVDREQTHDTRLFALALLLGSYFVYNSRGVIDGNAIEDLSLVVNLSKHIQTSSASGHGQSSSALHEYFPSFLWVVRDFTLQLQDQGKEITSKQYLENALKPQGGFSADVAGRDQIRMLLSDFFRERDCVTLVRPVEDEAQLRNLPNIPYGDLRGEFRSKFEAMKTRLFDKAAPKSLYGKALNGAMFTNLAKSYVEALNSGKAPVISSAWTRVVQAQCEDAVDDAVAAFKKHMNARVADYVDGKEQFADRFEGLLTSATQVAADAQVVNAGAGTAQFDEFGNLKKFVAGGVVPSPKAVDVDVVVAAPAKKDKPELEHVTLPVSAADLEAIYDLCDKLADRALRAADIGDQPDMQPFRNAAASMVYCKHLLSFLSDKKFNSFTTSTLGPLEYHQRTLHYLDDLKDLHADYVKLAMGPSADAAYCQYMSQSVFNQVMEWTEDTTRAHAAHLNTLQAQVNATGLQVASAQGQATAMKELAAQEVQKCDLTLKEAERKSKSDIDALRASLEYKTHELEHVLNHNATLRRLADTAQGAVTSSGQRSKWQQRYFVLTGAALRYYNTKDDFERSRSDDPPIDVGRAVIEEDRDVAEAFSIAFPDHSHDTLFLHAKSPAVKADWIEHLLKVRRSAAPPTRPMASANNGGGHYQF
ncbi:hypothetical protein DYB30_007418 [Aphanomyces astaci]|uniref:GB1/RHD3-type G domain-containing protein n=3 Tax=Aphanomyces astaci TaxID=112090 RepID=A0A397D726_APHAT|nr:hypothetical protein DYB30_007418 [Aphanomyces astaci]RHZ05573.1 hypothetical protein DYB31_005770 [Aphanomyces astaci]RHZ15239.1 hypothetical protein DYB26_009085 [Aphanomyces astaci]